MVAELAAAVATHHSAQSSHALGAPGSIAVSSLPATFSQPSAPGALASDSVAAYPWRDAPPLAERADWHAFYRDEMKILPLPLQRTPLAAWVAPVSEQEQQRSAAADVQLGFEKAVRDGLREAAEPGSASVSPASLVEAASAGAAKLAAAAKSAVVAGGAQTAEFFPLSGRVPPMPFLAYGGLASRAMDALSGDSAALGGAAHGGAGAGGGSAADAMAEAQRNSAERALNAYADSRDAPVSDALDLRHSVVFPPRPPPTDWREALSLQSQGAGARAPQVLL